MGILMGLLEGLGDGVAAAIKIRQVIGAVDAGDITPAQGIDALRTFVRGPAPSPRGVPERRALPPIASVPSRRRAPAIRGRR